jgi:DNA-binding LacI/PurR family transcriptional regulator
VYVNREATGVSSVTVDQGAIVRIALEHLTRLGHRRIAILNGPSSYWSSSERNRAIRDYGGPQRQRGLKLIEIDDLEPTFEGGWKATEQVASADVTGVFAFNDIMALGVLAAATANGSTIPTDLSIVGSDGVDVAAMSWPPLTTVVSPLDELGRRAVMTLALHLDGHGRRCHETLQPSLAVRGTTRDAPKRQQRRRTQRTARSAVTRRGSDPL